MPIIPTYERKYTVPGEGPNALQDVGAAGIVGNAIAKMGKTGMAIADDVGDIIIKREKELKDQADTNLLIQKGAEFDQEWQATEIQMKKDYRGNEATGVIQKGNEWIKQASERYALKDNEKANIKLQQHIMSRGNQLANALASHEAQEIKIAATNVRNFTLETSMKEAQLNPANVVTAVATYERALDSQLANKSITSEEYAILKKTGVSQIREANIEAIMAYDPVSALTAFNSVKDQLTTQTQERLDKTLKPSVTRQTALTVATEVFKTDPAATTETMIDKVKERKDLTPEGKDLAIQHIKDQVAVRHNDQERVRVQTSQSMFQKLNKIALDRGGETGINMMSDLKPKEWSDWNEIDPVAVKNLQDGMRREADYLDQKAKQETQAKRAEEQFQWTKAQHIRTQLAQDRQDRLQTQAEHESSIMILPREQLMTYNLDADRVAGLINLTQYNRLKAFRDNADPAKSDVVKNLLIKLNTGAAVAEAYKIDKGNANEVASLRVKLGDLLKTYARNNMDKPDFDEKVTAYADKYIFQDLTTSWFATDATDVQERIQAATLEAGPKKVPGSAPARPKPTLEEYMVRAKTNPAWKGKTDAQIKMGYQRDYGAK